MRLGFVLLGIGVATYLANVLLIWGYLAKRAPGVIERSAELPPDPDGRRLWEYTAGTGLVPRWVSLLGILPYPFVILGIVVIAIGLL